MKCTERMYQFIPVISSSISERWRVDFECAAAKQVHHGLGAQRNTALLKEQGRASGLLLCRWSADARREPVRGAFS